MYKNCLLTLCFISFSSFLFSQEPAHIHYGIQDGLPTTQIYQSIQDSRGFMWFATDRGLVRYNGYEFHTLTQSDGLPDDVVFGFHKDRNDRVWFYTYNGGIAYLENDSVRVPSFNDSLIDKLGNTVIGTLYLDEQDTIWLGSRWQPRVVKIDPTGKVHITKYSKGLSQLRITEIDSRGFIFGFSGEVAKSKEVLLQTLGGSYVFQLPEVVNYDSPIGCAIKTTQSFYCAQSRSLFEITSSGIQQETTLADKVTVSLFKDKQGDIWVGVYNGGAFRFKQGNLNSLPDNYLRDYSVSSIYEDEEGGYWFTTLFAGIFYVMKPSLCLRVTI